MAIKQINLKIVNKDSEKFLQTLKNEINNMRLLDHPNIVKLYDVKKSPNNLYLIVEFCNNGSLETYLKKNF